MDNEYFASINEVSKRLNVPAHTLRYWEKQFPVAIRPTTGAGGRRYYRAETVDRLVVIKDLLYVRGMTIAGVKKMLQNGELPKSMGDIPTAPPAPVAMTPDVAKTPTAPCVDTSQIDMAISLLEQAKNLLD